MGEVIVGLVAAVATITAAVITTRTWPTLPRRIHDHAALAKELPPDMGRDLRGLLAEELDQLVERDRRRLNPRVNRGLNIQRAVGIIASVLVGATILTFMGWMVYGRVAIPGFSSAENPFQFVDVTVEQVGVLVAIAAVVSIALLAALAIGLAMARGVTIKDSIAYVLAKDTSARSPDRDPGH